MNKTRVEVYRKNDKLFIKCENASIKNINRCVEIFKLKRHDVLCFEIDKLDNIYLIRKILMS